MKGGAELGCMTLGVKTPVDHLARLERSDREDRFRAHALILIVSTETLLLILAIANELGVVPALQYTVCAAGHYFVGRHRCCWRMPYLADQYHTHWPGRMIRRQ